MVRPKAEGLQMALTISTQVPPNGTNCPRRQTPGAGHAGQGSGLTHSSCCAWGQMGLGLGQSNINPTQSWECLGLSGWAEKPWEPHTTLGSGYHSHSPSL